MTDNKKIDRSKILLRAAYDLLTKCDRSGYVLNAMEVTTFYDEADCDGHCLRDEIATELGIDTEEDPINLYRESDFNNFEQDQKTGSDNPTVDVWTWGDEGHLFVASGTSKIDSYKYCRR